MTAKKQQRQGRRREPKQPRDRHRPIKVYVTDAEREGIEAMAASARLPVSSYLVVAGLNHPIRAPSDMTAVREMASLHGDLGRSAGLLKLWLGTKKGEGAAPQDVELLMLRLRETQAAILDAAGRL